MNIKLIEEALDSRNYQQVLEATFAGCQTVLDCGAGDGQALRRLEKVVPVRIGIEIFRPYIEARKYPSDSIVINADLEDIDSLFIDKSVDGILLSDVVEHFEKDDGLRLVEKAQRIARKVVAIWIPWGVHEQTYDDYGYDNHFFQTHKSYWEPEEFQSLGFKTHVYDKYHTTHKLKQNVDPRAGWAIKVL